MINFSRWQQSLLTYHVSYITKVHNVIMASTHITLAMMKISFLFSLQPGTSSCSGNEENVKQGIDVKV